MEINNRELASLLWIGAFIGYAILNDKKGQIAQAIRGIIRALSERKIVAILAWTSLWIILCVQVLRYFALWDISNLKTTLIWALTFAFVTLFDASRISEDETYFSKTLRDTFSATVIVTFISEAYSFPLVVELILVPLIALMVVVQVISEKNAEHAPVIKLANIILAFAGLAYIGYGLYMAATNLRDFATWNNFRDFHIPITLSLLFLPYLYLVSVLMSYELTFVGLRWALKDEGLRRYAAYQAIFRFRFDLDGLRRWKRHIGIFRPNSRKEIRDSIAEIKANQKRERNPPPVPPERGWCPIAATKFLTDHSLVMGDYHRSDDGLWRASSPMRVLNEESIFPDNIAYYIEGDKGVVKRLTLKLNVNDRSGGIEADTMFKAISISLLESSGPVPLTSKQRILRGDEIDENFEGRRIRVQQEDFVNPDNGYSKMLFIDHSPSPQVTLAAQEIME